MENASLVSLSRQMSLQREMDVIANNVANLTTTGYKREAVLFKEQLQLPAKVNNFMEGDKPVSFVIDWATVHDMTEGGFQQTGNPTDIALKGDNNVFLTVQTPEGVRYTRNGALQISQNGTLVTNEGYPVQGDGGPIQFGPTESDLAFGADGSISTRDGLRGKLKLVRFENPNVLQKEGLSLFKTETAPLAPIPGKVTVSQGALERSNVKPVLEMTRMMEVTRAYESIAQTIKRSDDVRRQAIERLARVPS